MEEKVITEVSSCDACPLFRHFENGFMECKFYSSKPGTGIPMNHSPSKKPAFCKIAKLKAVF